ncbi:hypothetical protein CVV43_05275 [Candidatus Saccharibacteria bacterium HGW-Saccharibacteria-1]|jgi:hypothetical protein|nr:MAG: hypothetical protein CVV43_05275 [Candidatus Saccharibacteria bacterium HGW-Saccharibacteria-1]
MDSYPKRRIFINKGEEHYQVFSFKQERDGSIYCASPDFSEAKWISYEYTPSGPIIKMSSSHFPGHRVCLKLLFRERSGVSRWAHF